MPSGIKTFVISLAEHIVHDWELSYKLVDNYPPRVLGFLLTQYGENSTISIVTALPKDILIQSTFFCVEGCPEKKHNDYILNYYHD